MSFVGRVLRSRRLGSPAGFSPEQITAVAVLGFVMAATGFAGSLLTVAVDPIATSFGVDDAGLGVVTAITRAGNLIAIAGAVLADRFGRRRVILYAAGLTFVACGFSALAGTLTVFTTLQVLVRGGVNLTTIVALIAVIEHAPEKARAWALAAAGILAALGFVAGSALLPIADLRPQAWRVLFALGGLGLVFLPGIARRLQEPSRFNALGARGQAKEIVDRMYGSRFWTVAAVGFLLNIFFAPSSAFTNRFLADERGYSGFGILVLRATMQAVPSLVAVWAGGRLSESKGRRPAAVTGSLVMAVTTAVFFLSGGLVLWVALLVSTAAAALASPALVAFNTELFPTEVRGTAGAGLLLAAVAGSAVGLLLTGYLAEPLGSIGKAVALTSLAPFVCALFLIPRLPEARGKDLDELSPPEV